MSRRIPPTDVLRRLSTEYLNAAGKPDAPKYHTFLMAIVAGDVPAERNATGSRWLVSEDHIPEIASRYGLTKSSSDGTAITTDGQQAA
jgi:hypothetical protein